jgi:hypothetical protein
VDWLSKFWWDIFSRGPKKKKKLLQNAIADLKKKKNSKGLLPPRPNRKFPQIKLI